LLLLLLLLLLMSMINLLLMGILILLWRLSLRARDGPGSGCTPELRLGRRGGAAGGLRKELLLTLRWGLCRLLLLYVQRLLRQGHGMRVHLLLRWRTGEYISSSRPTNTTRATQACGAFRVHE
jgi:hypothetical protein